MFRFDRKLIPILTYILALVACSDLGDTPSEPDDTGGGSEDPTNATVVVDMHDSFFDPDSVVIAAGDTVRWVNVGLLIHTTTSGISCSSDGLWNSGSLNPSQTFEWVFPDEGEYPYYCIPHCLIGMFGHVRVEASP